MHAASESKAHGKIHRVQRESTNTKQNNEEHRVKQRKIERMRASGTNFARLSKIVALPNPRRPKGLRERQERKQESKAVIEHCNNENSLPSNDGRSRRGGWLLICRFNHPERDDVTVDVVDRLKTGTRSRYR